MLIAIAVVLILAGVLLSYVVRHPLKTLRFLGRVLEVVGLVAVAMLVRRWGSGTSVRMGQPSHGTSIAK